MGSSSPYPEVNEPTGLAGGGCELWASKALNLAWLPRCDNRHNPSLLSATLPEAVRVENPPTADPNSRPVWFWRVEPTFGAWVWRAIQRADSSGVRLDAILREMSETIKDYLIRTFPGCWDGIETRCRAGPVVLPGAPILAEVARLARYDPAIRWDGWEKSLSKDDDESVDTVRALPSLTTTPGAVRRPAGRRKPEPETPGMF